MHNVWQSAKNYAQIQTAVVHMICVLFWCNILDEKPAAG